MNKTQVRYADNKRARKTEENIKIMLWNIEGLKNAMSTVPTDFLQGYDIAILTESFLIDNWQHPDYHCTHLKAKQGERGRPAGGIAVLIKPELTPIISTNHLEHTLMIETKHITIISAYFQPNKSAIDIIDEIGQMIAQCRQYKPIIIAGDLNSRLDTQN